MNSVMIATHTLCTGCTAGLSTLFTLLSHLRLRGVIMIMTMGSMGILRPAMGNFRTGMPAALSFLIVCQLEHKKGKLQKNVVKFSLKTKISKHGLKFKVEMILLAIF